MKIAIVCFNLGWQAGGPRLIFSFAQALKRAGSTVVLYAPDYNPNLYPDLSAGLDVRAITPPKPLDWQYKSASLAGRIFEKLAQRSAVRALAREAARVMDADFDVVNFHDYAYKSARWYKKRNPRAVAVWTMNDAPYEYLPKESFLYDFASQVFNAYTDVIERWYFRSIDRAVVFIERNRRWTERHGITTGLIWPGVEYEKFSAPVKKFSEPKKSFTLLAVGAFNKYRRYDEVASAVALLRKDGYDARATIICKDIWNKADERTELVEHVTNLGIAPYVTLRFDGASEEELKKIYREADLYVSATHLPPPRDGFSWGLAIFEAIAAGLPVLVTSKNDVREALAEGKTAFLFSPGHPEEMAAKAKRVMDDPKLYYDVASRAQELVRKFMTWDTYAERFLKLARNFPS